MYIGSQFGEQTDEEMKVLSQLGIKKRRSDSCRAVAGVEHGHAAADEGAVGQTRH